MSRTAVVLGSIAVAAIVAVGALSYRWVTTRSAEPTSAAAASVQRESVPQVTGCDGFTYAAGGKGVDVCADPAGVLFMAGLKIKASSMSPYSDKFVGTSQCSNVILASTVPQTLNLELKHFAIQAPGQSSPKAATESLNSTLTNRDLNGGAMTTARVCTDTTRAGDYTLVYAPVPPNGDRGIWTSQVG